VRTSAASRGDIGVEGLSLLTEDLPSEGLVWQRFRLASHLNPLLKLPASSPAATSVAARQVRRHHRITVIRCSGAPPNRSSTESRQCAGSGQPLLSPSIALLRVPVIPARQNVLVHRMAGFRGRWSVGK
jgi:hypothetical protein